MNYESETGTSAEKFVVRLPPGMRKTIAESARRNRRSMNSEIVAIVDRALGQGNDQQHNNRDDSQSFSATLTQGELELIDRFRALPEQRRRAWLELIL